jgi:hypothetical protein
MPTCSDFQGSGTLHAQFQAHCPLTDSSYTCFLVRSRVFFRNAPAVAVGRVAASCNRDRAKAYL